MGTSCCFKRLIISVFLLVCFGANATLVHGQGLHVGFYGASCPRAEVIIKSTVRYHFNSIPSIAPTLLNLYFHDCFVRGCDASILIDGPTAEKTAEPNLGLRGYNVIEDAKSQLEAECPGVVSCADILALAARDSVVLTGGASWSVPTGRRDGRVSIASDTTNFPSFRDSIEILKKKFADKGLGVLDLVTLVGGHTVCTSACQFFSYRLYNFSTASSVDPSMNPAYATQLQKLCPQNGDATTPAAIDMIDPHHVDISLYKNLRNGRGTLEVDQKLWSDAPMRRVVQDFLVWGADFKVEFGISMVRMGNIDVKTCNEGKSHRICSTIN